MTICHWYLYQPVKLLPFPIGGLCIRRVVTHSYSSLLPCCLTWYPYYTLLFPLSACSSLCLFGIFVICARVCACVLVSLNNLVLEFHTLLSLMSVHETELAKYLWRKVSKISFRVHHTSNRQTLWKRSPPCSKRYIRHGNLVRIVCWK
jgi:hypothetical protein